MESLTHLFPMHTLSALMHHDQFCIQLQRLTEQKRKYIERIKKRREEERQQAQENIKLNF